MWLPRGLLLVENVHFKVTYIIILIWRWGIMVDISESALSPKGQSQNHHKMYCIWMKYTLYMLCMFVKNRQCVWQHVKQVHHKKITCGFQIISQKSAAFLMICRAFKNVKFCLLTIMQWSGSMKSILRFEVLILIIQEACNCRVLQTYQDIIRNSGGVAALNDNQLSSHKSGWQYQMQQGCNWHTRSPDSHITIILVLLPPI